MGNPVITRLGINQFWYKHWCTDHKYSRLIKEDSIYNSYLSLYLNYGATFKSNPFLHEYWYKKQFRLIRSKNYDNLNLQAFRRYFYTNDRLGIEHSYFIRYRTGEYFPMRYWVMRYGSWIFLSVHWFKPLKTKSFTKLKVKKNMVSSISRSTANINSLKRLSLVKQFYTSAKYKNLNYTF